MTNRSRPLGSLAVLAALALTAACGDSPDDARAMPAAGAGEAAPAAQDAQAKIAEAESAAPREIARHATIMDWPATPDGEPVMLREGTNGWVCYPSTPDALGIEGEDPMCLDDAWQAWAVAWFSRTPPDEVRKVGIGYMLRGDIGASNVDPYATGPTDDNQWVVTGPHIMIVVPNVSDLEEVPTDPASGGPYVMWQGTPYAHIMVPVTSR